MNNIESFAAMLIDEIRRQTEESPTFAYAEYGIQSVKRFDNTGYLGLSIRFTGENASPIIPLNDYYVEMLSGEKSLEAIAGEIIQRRRDMTDPDLSPITRISFSLYESIKDHLMIRLTDSSCRDSINPDLVQTDQGVFTATYCISCKGNNEDYCVGITYNMLKHYGIDPGTLHQDALESMKNSGFRLASLQDMIGLFIGEKETNYIGEDESISPEIMDFMVPPVFALTNTDKHYGASAILQQDLMDRITDVLGDVFIIPSSTEEVLLIPAEYNGQKGMDPEELQSMLVEINGSDVVPPDVFLSNSLLAYEKSGSAPIPANKYLEKQHGIRKEADKLPAPAL